MTKDVVLDSFALICLLQEETGFERVRDLLYSGTHKDFRIFLSIINWGELFYIIRRRFGPEKADAVLQLIEQLPIEIVPAEAGLVRQAATIKADFTVSYADAFAVATAMAKEATVMTSDPEFRAVESLVGIMWLK